MRRTRISMLALAAILSIGPATLGQDEEPKPVRLAPPRVGDRVIVLSKDESIPMIPQASLEFLKTGSRLSL